MPSEKIIVADSSPLIGLAKIGCLDLLPKLSERVIVPLKVWEEVTVAKLDAADREAIVGATWIERIEADSSLSAPLSALVDAGEAEAIALAQSMPGSVVLIDDLRGRKLTERLGVRRMGTLAILARSKQRGHLDRVQPYLDKLAAAGIFISVEIKDAVLKEMGEA